MAERVSVWRRLKNVIAPPRESYDTRQPRPGEADDRRGSHYPDADQRRSMDPPY